MNRVILSYRPDALPEVEMAVLSAHQDGASEVVLDLDAIEMLDTAGVRGLIQLLRRSRAAGGELALQTSKPVVRRTLAVTALDRIFSLVEEAA